MTSVNSELNAPWYKEFWLWFILTPLIVVICASFVMLYVAIRTHDGVVLDNFYRDGKGYVLRNKENQFALTANLSADLTFNPPYMVLNLNGNLNAYPKHLNLILAHPTNHNFDHIVHLSKLSNNQYQGRLDETIESRRILQLEPLGSDIQWRLHYQGALPSPTDSISLIPK